MKLLLAALFALLAFSSFGQQLGGMAYLVQAHADPIASHGSTIAYWRSDRGVEASGTNLVSWTDYFGIQATNATARRPFYVQDRSGGKGAVVYGGAHELYFKPVSSENVAVFTLGWRVTNGIYQSVCSPVYEAGLGKYAYAYDSSTLYVRLGTINCGYKSITDTAATSVFSMWSWSSAGSGCTNMAILNSGTVTSLVATTSPGGANLLGCIGSRAGNAPTIAGNDIRVLAIFSPPPSVDEMREITAYAINEFGVVK